MAMNTVKKSALVPYSAAAMFELVDRVESYPDFLPWCESAIVHHRDEDTVHATLSLSAAGFTQSFTTHNLRKQDKMIEIKLVKGPFHHLEGFWRFDPIEEQACQVILDLEFELVNPILKLTLGPLFSQAANTLVDAFCKRAKVVYGPR